MLNVLLQILDDGQITDAHGRKVNFENTVIVMTSNAGSDSKSAGAVGFGGSADDQGRERTMKALRDFLRPEFLNRVDEIVCFNHLTKENFSGIARIMLDELKTSLSEKGFAFRYDERWWTIWWRSPTPDLRGAQPAPPDPKGAGGPHGRPHHRQLRASHRPDQRHRPGRRGAALYTVR